MRYVVYFVPKESIHPCTSLDLYKKLWPIMKKSVNDLGHELVHITDDHTPCWGDSAFRIELDPSTTIYSRDVAWLAYLASLKDREQACMIEPDTILVRDIPPIKKGCNMVLLQRPQSYMAGWFKLATKLAMPFYRQVIKNYDGLPEEMKVFHGDIRALHRTIGIGDHEKAERIPMEACGVKIEVRNWYQYGFRKGHDPYLLQFKGGSKPEMLKW